MILKKTAPFLFALLSAISIQAEEAKPAAPLTIDTAIEADSSDSLEIDLHDKEAEKIALISEAFGHIIAKHIESLEVDFDFTHIVKGLQDAGLGKESPMSETECIEAITKSRETRFNELAKINLDLANAFMKKNQIEPNVSVIEEGKLHFRIEKEGEGDSVQEGYSPVIRYTGKFIDGTIFGASKGEDLVTLDETIPGFGKGLLGMKEGEKRTLYIHPDLAYGTMGQLPPNSLLLFEIELVKANSELPKEPTFPVTQQDDMEKQTVSLDSTKDSSPQ
jgi:peptidylprolyl isomerase